MTETSYLDLIAARVLIPLSGEHYETLAAEAAGRRLARNSAPDPYRAAANYLRRAHPGLLDVEVDLIAQQAVEIRRGGQP